MYGQVSAGYISLLYSVSNNLSLFHKTYREFTFVKHLFVISSHITFLISKSIQKYLAIPEEDALFIKIRNYEHSELQLNKVINFTDIDIHLNNTDFIQFYKKSSLVKKIDLRIQQNIGSSPFIVYVPHVATPIMQSLITHQECQKVAVIEEGTLSYCNNNFKVPSYFKPREILRYIVNFNIHGRRFYKIKPYDFSVFKQTPQFFALTPIAFENSPFKVTVVPLAKLPEEKYTINNKDSLLVLDAGVEHGQLKFETLKTAITLMFNDINCSHLHIKYHPAQNHETINVVENECKNKGIEYSVIPREHSIEQLMSNNKLHQVIGFSTSLLMYGIILKQKVKSYEYLLLEDSVYQQHRNSLDFDLSNILERLAKMESPFV